MAASRVIRNKMNEAQELIDTSLFSDVTVVMATHRDLLIAELREPQTSRERIVKLKRQSSTSQTGI